MLGSAMLMAILLAPPDPGRAVARASQDNIQARCSDDRGADRCASERQAATRALFGAPTIAALAAEGDIRRVFYVDGYGRDLIAITAVRSRGGAAELRVAFPAVAEEARSIPLVAALTPEQWDQIRARYPKPITTSTLPTKTSSRGEGSLCLHAWMYTLEAADAGKASAEVESACEDGPGQVFASYLAETAVPLFAACAALDRNAHRNAASLLHACRLLKGDGIRAAEVMNRASGFSRVASVGDAPRLEPLFAPGARIEWSGIARGKEAPAVFWGRNAPSGIGWTNMYIQSVEGLSAREVRLRGSISRTVDTPRGRATGSQTATIDQLWRRGSDGISRVVTAKIGPWASSP